MKLAVLFNAACPICAREIAHYQRLAQRHGAAVAFEDLNTSDLSRWGISADTARRRLHARRGAQVLSGLDAFRALWAALPGWRWLARLTGLPLVRPLASSCYERLLAPALYRRSCPAAGCDLRQGAGVRREARCPGEGEFLTKR